VRLAQDSHRWWGTGQHRQSGIGRGDRGDDVCGAVGRAVVEHQDVGLGQPPLREQRTNRRLDTMGFIAGRNEKGYRSGHRRRILRRASQEPQIDQLVRSAETRQ
jgi:hypothetical protein